MRSGVTIASVLLLALPAWAHPLVDRGRALYREADLTGALEAFEAAEAAEDLGRADLALMLEGRVLVHMALGHDRAVSEDLAQLVSLDPDHRFGAEVPPEITERFARLCAASPGPVGVTVEAQAAGAGIRLRVQVDRDATHMERGTRLHVRLAGQGWRTVADPSTEVAADEVDYWAELVGPGGAVIATAGSPDQVMHTAVRSSAVGPAPPPPVDEGGGSTWLWIAGGAAAAALVATVVVVLATSGNESDRTRPTYPIVEF